MKAKMKRFETLASGLLKSARMLLLRDKFLAPVAFVFGAEDENMTIVGMRWTSNEDKIASMSTVSQLARCKKAEAVMLVADAHYKTVSKKELHQYRPGQLQRELTAECIMLVGKVRLGYTFGMTLPYERNGKQIVFREVESSFDKDFENLQVDLIPNWWVEA